MIHRVCENLYVKDVEIDSRPVVVQRARIMRHRAKVEKWSLKCSFEIEEDICAVDDVHQILSDSGRRAGLGDYRPQKGGPFGRFLVSEWKLQKQ